MQVLAPPSYPAYDAVRFGAGEAYVGRVSFGGGAPQETLARGVATHLPLQLPAVARLGYTRASIISTFQVQPLKAYQLHTI